MHHSQPKATNQSMEEGLSAVNKLCVPTAQCATSEETTHRDFVLDSLSYQEDAVA